MAELLRKPFGTHGKVHDITPASAGWRYVGFGLYHLRAGDRAALEHVADAAWQMNEGSICGLGQAAPLPLTTALEHFPEDFAS